MKRLIISNTHYQTIIAVQLTTTLFKDDEVVLLISDHSNGAEDVARRLKEQHLFADVRYFISRELLYEKKVKGNIWDCVSFVGFRKNRYKYYLEKIDNLYFDELLVFNFEADIYGLFSILYMYNKNIRISRFEEGILSYVNKESTSKKLMLSCYLRNVFGKKSALDAKQNFYCFYPSFYAGDYQAIQIPKINADSICVEVLKKAFNVNDSVIDYKEKYIFFTSVYDFEGGEPIGEYEIVKYIANLVGKDNILIKLHPRDNRGLYQQEGFRVDKNSSIPWEIIQLISNFENKVFLTATSGVLLSSNTMSSQPVRSLYLYNMCNLDNNYAKQTTQELRNILEDKSIGSEFGFVKIVEKRDELEWIIERNTY